MKKSILISVIFLSMHLSAMSDSAGAVRESQDVAFSMEFGSGLGLRTIRDSVVSPTVFDLSPADPVDLQRCENEINKLDAEEKDNIEWCEFNQYHCEDLEKRLKKLSGALPDAKVQVTSLFVRIATIRRYLYQLKDGELAQQAGDDSSDSDASAKSLARRHTA